MSELARHASERGEVVLLRRERDEAVELRVNGVFVMDDVETSSEQLLARATLAALAAPAGRAVDVLVGGLGLGFTLAAVLEDARVGRVVVAEIEPSLVRWHRDGTLDAELAVPSPVADSRVRIAMGDVREVVASIPAGSIDLILLDVDNGPGYLVHDANSAVYGEEFLQICRSRCRPRGLTAVWSAAPAPALADAMQRVFGSVDERAVPVTLGRRETTYHLYLGVNQASGS